jgi:hypothetical protein
VDASAQRCTSDIAPLAAPGRGDSWQRWASWSPEGVETQRVRMYVGARRCIRLVRRQPGARRTAIKSDADVARRVVAEAHEHLPAAATDERNGRHSGTLIRP